MPPPPTMWRAIVLALGFLTSASTAIDCSTLPKRDDFGNVGAFADWKAEVSLRRIPGRYDSTKSSVDNFNVAMIHLTEQNCFQNGYLQQYCQSAYTLSPGHTHDQFSERALMIMSQSFIETFFTGQDSVPTHRAFTFECTTATTVLDPEIPLDVQYFVSTAIQAGGVTKQTVKDTWVAQAGCD